MGIRDRVVEDIRRRGLQPVARDLGVPRSTLASYALESSTAGSALLIEQRATQHYGDRSLTSGGPRAL